ncbi:MAG: hypothetical protein U1E02_33370 [Hydrogenophaga sp.]|uniref:hypothetical protein n=1 Tax=Hydrogenophaga sp. TaxID=1904254 RepID=UPI002731673E|nr:hypothetical protein [Hydrogenophaga sp.]MDP1683840.1 hypothetical protein [Hydrogenophaga sp.]MDP1782916.1 hypothetical protein [Hydrogenophaga sp.]MDP2251945.1 hypothetical protein [Hydrogenophaga sp.]MDZ4129024.1 hypothetical protein [Hydrogenophaga sp.]
MSSSWSVECPAAPDPDAAPCRVLLVVDDPGRQALLKGCVQKHLPGCRIEMVDSYYDAMSRATRLQTDLLVLDLSLDSVLVPALKRFLARAAPQALVHVFDDSQDSAPGAGTDCNRPSILQLKQAFASLADLRSPPL